MANIQNLANFFGKVQSNRIYKGMRFITGLKYNQNVLNILNSITFIYNPFTFANYTNEAKNMLPLAFFHVVKSTEIMQSDLSTQKMLFYNSLSATTQGNQAGVVNIVADNLVNKPKTYSLDIIIPFNSILLFQNTYPLNSYLDDNIKNFMFRTESLWESAQNSILGASNTATSTIREIVKSIIAMCYTPSQNETLSSIALSSLTDVVTDTPNYNKNSIERMWRERSILKMKVWNSWDYKYVAITNFEVTKEGKDQGIYEAKLTVSEVPILTMSASRTESTNSNIVSNALRDSKEQAVTTVLDSKEN